MFLLFFVCISVNINFKSSPICVNDEHGFVVTGSILFNEFFIERNFFSDVWKNKYQNYGVHNPRVGLYILGALNNLANEIYHKFHFENKNFILLRHFVAVFAAGSLVLIFLFVLKSEGKQTAFIATVLLLINPVFRSVQDALTNDIFMFFFFALSLLFLFFINEDAEKKQWSFKWIFLFSLSAGLAISCKLYSVSIYFVLCLVLLKNFNKYFWKRSVLSFLSVSFIMLAVFVLSNPLMYTDFFTGIYALTKGHIKSLGLESVELNVFELRHMFLYPYMLFKWNAFSIKAISEQERMIFLDYFWVFGIILLVIRGIFVCYMREKYLPVFLFVVAHLWLAYPVMVLGYYCIMPKMFIILVVAIIYMVSVSCSDLFSQLSGLIKDRLNIKNIS